MLKLVASNDIIKRVYMAAEGIPEIVTEVIDHCLNMLIPNNSVRVGITFAGEADTWFSVRPIQHSDFLHYYAVEINPNAYEEMDPFDFVSDLCHECIHIKQFVTKELQIISEEYYWKGEPLSENAFDVNSWEYWFEDSEIEAMGCQTGLAKSWFGRYQSNWKDFFKLLELGVQEK